MKRFNDLEEKELKKLLNRLRIYPNTEPLNDYEVWNELGDEDQLYPKPHKNYNNMSLCL